MFDQSLQRCVIPQGCVKIVTLNREIIGLVLLFIYMCWSLQVLQVFGLPRPKEGRRKEWCALL